MRPWNLEHVHEEDRLHMVRYKSVFFFGVSTGLNVFGRNIPGDGYERQSALGIDIYPVAGGPGMISLIC